MWWKQVWVLSSRSIITGLKKSFRKEKYGSQNRLLRKRRSRKLQATSCRRIRLVACSLGLEAQKNMMLKQTIIYACTITAVFFLFSCSNLKYLPAGDSLYTRGNIKIHAAGITRQ